MGAAIEAWAELRVHRGRVLLSLIGVAVATCSLTTVIAAGDILARAGTQQVERSNGRPATYAVSISLPDERISRSTANIPDSWNVVVQAHDIQEWSRVFSDRITADFPSGSEPIDVTYVDQPYAAIHRLQVVNGAWFTRADAGRLVPAVVLNPIAWQSLGSPALERYPVVRFDDISAIVVGVTDPVAGDLSPSMYALASDANKFSTNTSVRSNQSANYEVWLPEQVAAPLVTQLSDGLTASLGEGTKVEVERQDLVAEQTSATRSIQALVIAVSLLVLVLGALSLVNIAIITVRQRIREIGVRRSFGASTRRVFFSILLESLLGTASAGVIGVLAAVLIVTNPFVLEILTRGQAGVDAHFPVYAAVLGQASSMTVGAISGLIPAIIAVRIKVIDAIRF